MSEPPEQVEPGRGQIEWVDLGDVSRVDSGGPAGRPGLTPVHLLIGGVVVVAIVIAVLAATRGDSKPPAATRPTTSVPAPRPTPPDGGPATPAVVPPEPAVTQVSPNILGVHSGWELFGLGPTAVVRVELAAGRVTTTGVPAVQSTGPVSFVVTGDRAIIRPLDDVPSYVVVDGSGSARLGGALGQVNVVLPGPDPRHIWRQIGSSGSTAVGLATVDGTLVGARYSPPATGIGLLEPDGAGYFYFIGVGGVYDVRAGALNRVTTGSLVAVGASRWVAVECDDAYRCWTVALDVGSGTRRVIGGPRPLDVPIGSVAPDGSVAATYRLTAGGRLSLQLLDLATGRTLTVPVRLGQDVRDGTIVWAPDSSRLFVIDADDRVEVVDPHSGRARRLALDLPPLSQLAVRATG